MGVRESERPRGVRAHREPGATPKISVIMPVYNEAAYIGAALSSLLTNDPPGGYEILVLDGMSDDGTRDVVRGIEERHAAVRLLDNPERTVPHAMNRGIRRARGDVVVRVDGHVEVPPDFLEACLVELAEHPECACVGGAIENVSESDVAEAISLAMASPFGVGDARFRLGDQEGYVDTLAFGAYRKEDLVRIGLFDEVLTRNQDDELNFRLVQAGRRIWLSRRIRSRYYVRSSFAKLFRQYRQYGYWKVYVNRKHRTVTTSRQLIPPAFVAIVVLLATAMPFAPVVRWPFAAVVSAYAVASLGFATKTSPRPGRVPPVMLAFATLHVAYGLGYLEGIVDFFVLRRRPTARRAHVSR